MRLGNEEGMDLSSDHMMSAQMWVHYGTPQVSMSPFVEQEPLPPSHIQVIGTGSLELLFDPVKRCQPLSLPPFPFYCSDLG